MDLPDFNALSRKLEDNDFSGRKKLLNLVRSRFPTGNYRYDRLFWQLRVINTAEIDIPRDKDETSSKSFGDRLYNMGRGQEHDLCALLLRWLWFENADATKSLLLRSGVTEIEYTSPSGNDLKTIKSQSEISGEDDSAYFKAYTRFVARSSTEILFDPGDKIFISLGELIGIERQLANSRYVISDATGAIRLLLAKRDHIARIDAYLAAHNDMRIMNALSALYELGHWADQKAHESQSFFNATALTALDRTDDRASPSFVRLALNLVNNYKMIGDKPGERRAYGHLSELASVRQTGEFAATAVFRADYLLNDDRGMTAQEACDSFLREPDSGMNKVARASVWRCQACVALKANQSDRVFQSVAMSRELLKDSRLLTAEEKMIPVYLDAIEAIHDYRLHRTMPENAVNSIRAVLNRIREVEPQSLPLTIVLYDTLAEIYDHIANRDGDNSGDVRGRAVFATMTASRLLPSSIKEFCLFDMEAIQRRIFSEMDRLGQPTGEPFSG